MAPFVDFLVNVQRFCTLGALRYNDLSAALIHLFYQPVVIKGFISQKCLKSNAFDQWLHTNWIMALASQKLKSHQIAQSIGQSEDFGCPTAF